MRNSYACGFGLNSYEYKKNDILWQFYQNDGSGRDTYISNDNGGFQKPRHITGKPINDLSKNSLYQRDPHHEITGKHINYLQDGTGRDSYIFMSNGGFYP